jgi:hypothetical protein
MKYIKVSICLSVTMLLNGSFTPIGEGKTYKGISHYVSPDEDYERIQNSISDKMAVLDDIAKHEDRLRLLSIVAQDSHNRTVDSLSNLINNIKP